MNIERENTMSTATPTPEAVAHIEALYAKLNDLHPVSRRKVYPYQADLPAYRVTHSEFIATLRSEYPDIDWRRFDNGCATYVQMMAMAGLPWHS
jgi:hypothetical protein